MLTAFKGDGLQDHHQIYIPSEVHTQKDKARDLRLIFTDKITVKFIMNDNSVDTPTGRWCNICK